MNIKHLSGILCLFTLSVSTAEAIPLTIELRDGTIFEIPSDDLEIAFESEMMKADWTGGNRTIPVSEISSFYFYATPTSASGIATDANEKINVYSPEGLFYGTFSSMEEATDNLTKGTYIFRTDSKTFKTVIR